MCPRSREVTLWPTCDTGKAAAHEGVVQHRGPSQFCRLERVAGSRIIVPRRKNSAHLHRPWRATSFPFANADRRRKQPGADVAQTDAIGLQCRITAQADQAFWKNWSTYKDVAHLIAAATLICAEARTRYRNKPLWPGGLSWSQFIPFQMTMLMPDLVLAVGLEFERVGLSALPHGRTEPILDPAAVWRIPPDINVVPIPPPIRKIRAEDLVVLNHRRAGSRGKANVTRTTPVFG